MSQYTIRPDRGAPRSGWHILTMFDVSFYVEPSFLFIVAYIFYSVMTQGGAFVDAGLLSFIIFFSILFHEMGHAFTARAFGERNLSVSLHMLGGSAYTSEAHPGKRLLVILAGPFCTFLIVMASRWAWQHFYMSFNPGIIMVLENAYFLNLVLLIINMLPIYPMDGGQALFNLMHFKLSYVTALRLIARISLITIFFGGAVCVLILHYNPGAFFILFIIGCVMTNLEILNQTRTP